MIHTSSNSFKCKYGLSYSKPWKLGSNEIIPGLNLKLLALRVKIKHDGLEFQGGCKYSRMVRNG